MMMKEEEEEGEGKEQKEEEEEVRGKKKEREGKKNCSNGKLSALPLETLISQLSTAAHTASKDWP